MNELAMQCTEHMLHRSLVASHYTLIWVHPYNVIEIEGLLFLGFGPMRALHRKPVFPIK